MLSRFGKEMRSLEFWVLLMAMVAAVAFLAFSSRITITNDGLELPSGSRSNGQVFKVSAANRKLKEESFYQRRTSKVKRDLGTVSTDDYPRYDPVPSSKASVKPGPIDHGTPLMPYLPSPTPPGPPKRGGVP